jgi:hypothetical protein
LKPDLARADSLKEIDFRSAVTGDIPEAELRKRVVSCPNCARKPNLTKPALRTPACATPVVTDTGLHRHIKPKVATVDERATAPR